MVKTRWDVQRANAKRRDEALKLAETAFWEGNTEKEAYWNGVAQAAHSKSGER